MKMMSLWKHRMRYHWSQSRRGKEEALIMGIYLHWRTFWLRSYQALEFQLYLILSLEPGILEQSIEHWNKCWTEVASPGMILRRCFSVKRYSTINIARYAILLTLHMHVGGDETHERWFQVLNLVLSRMYLCALSCSVLCSLSILEVLYYVVKVYLLSTHGSSDG